jgi:hypothetical protein
MENILDSNEEYEIISDNSIRSKAAFYLLLGVIFLDLIHLLSQYMQYSLLTTNDGVFSQAEAQMNNLRVSGIAILIVALHLTNIVFFVMWFRRAYNNLHKLGVRGLEYSEGWAAGC